MTEYKMTLSTTEPNNYVGLIKLRQGDKDSQVLNVTVTENGKLFKFDGLSVFFNSVLPNGTVVRDKVQTIDYTNSKLTYKVIDSFLQEVAAISAWFSFENGTKVVDSTKNFRYLVETGWQSCITQGNYIYELSEIQREIEEIIGNKDFTSLISKIDDLKNETTAQLAQKVSYYNTVSDMKNSNKLKNGDCVVTLGYYSPNDGGGATYKVGNDISDNYFVLSLAGGLTATLVISNNNNVNIKQIGGKPQDSNGKYDNKTYIDAYINRLNNLDNKTKRFKLYIPSGIWCFSPTTIYRYQGFSITGDINFAHRGISNEGTIINAMSDNQDFVWQIGNGTGMIYNFELGNFTMSASSYKASGSTFMVDTVYNVNNVALKFQGCAFGHVHNILFNEIYGTAFDITSSWEITFKKLIFRGIGGFTTPVMNFSKLLSSLSSYNPNLSNIMFDTLDFEGCAGDYINFEADSYFLNSEIRAIVVEVATGELTDSTGKFTDGIYDDTTATKLAIIRIKGELNGNHIGSILVNNIAPNYGIKGDIQYCYDTIINTTGSLYPINLDIDSINIHGADKDYNIILQNTGSPSSQSKVFIGRVYGQLFNGVKGIFNVNSFPSIKVMDMRYSDFHYDGEYLSPNVLPFQAIQYHVVDSGGASINGKLVYDTNTINKLSLAVKALTFVSEENSKVARFFNDSSKKISIRANLQNTMPITFKLTGYVGGVLTTQNVVLTGTGYYKWYDLLNPNTFDDNTYIEITIVTDKSVRLDVLKYN